MAVGFSSTTYTTTETIGNVNVCVAVTNPPSDGAVRPFSVTILPGEGIERFSLAILMRSLVEHYYPRRACAARVR